MQNVGAAFAGSQTRCGCRGCLQTHVDIFNFDQCKYKTEHSKYQRDLRFLELDQSRFCRTVERLFRDQVKHADPSRGGGWGGTGRISAELPASKPRSCLARATNTGQMVKVHIKSMLGGKFPSAHHHPATRLAQLHRR